MVTSEIPGTTQHRSELTITSSRASLRLVRVFVREVAQLAGLDGDARKGLVLAVEEACGNIIATAFDEDDPGEIRLTASLNPTSLTVSITEHGLPLDSSLAPADAGETKATIPGWRSMRHSVDEAHWFNHGREGSELRLITYRPQTLVTDHLDGADLVPVQHDVPRAPDQQYTIRRLRPEEAIQVAQCIYRAYGYSYPNDDLYYPDRIVHLNETGQLMSVVAVDESGNVVGHIALERPELEPVAESGQAVVMPAHRGRHLLERMRSSLEDEGRRIGLVHIFSEPVCSHVFSQRANEEMGSNVCGVRLGIIPQSVSFKKIKTEPLPQRESCMVYVKFLNPPSASVIYGPSQHRAMIERIYAHLGVPLEIREPERSAGQSRLRVSFDREWSFGLIRVDGIGARTASEIEQARRDLTEASAADVVYLELPLSEPETPYVCSAAEDDGFFFSGVIPSMTRSGDVLRLQYLNVNLDTSLLQVASPFGKEVVEYAARQRELVG
jgi:anti-sigma regulatory factor (Ser/Thr protein kinase)